MEQKKFFALKSKKGIGHFVRLTFKITVIISLLTIISSFCKNIANYRNAAVYFEDTFGRTCLFLPEIGDGNIGHSCHLMC